MYSRVFTVDDQQAFAELSGDFNPLHIDPVAARRYLFGRLVVHGIHTLLWSLDCWLAYHAHSGAAQLLTLKASFLKPAVIDEPLQLELIAPPSGPSRLELRSEGSLLMRSEMTWREASPDSPVGFTASHPEKLMPRALSEEEMVTAAGSLDLHLEVAAATRLFPSVMRSLPPGQIAAILATTRLVGVECPGLHSVYSELELSATDGRNISGLRYTVAKWDPRFHLAIIRIEAPGMAGTVKAFRRPEPTSQPGYLELKDLVDPGEFAGQRALIIGGSRGLGEVAAKLLASGGAAVRATYHLGQDDARRVVGEIASHGGSAQCVRFDVLDTADEAAEAELIAFGPTHLYYFATPFISSATKGRFSARVFGKFCAYYVDGFVRVIELFKDGQLKKAFYPSSVFVHEIPVNMGEYAAAKMAGETMCEFLVKTHRGLTIAKPRLPRMATDQTSSLMPVENRDVAPILLPLLREFARNGD